MKIKFITFVFLTLSFAGSAFAQMNNGMGRMRAKVEQLEKMKLIETLNLNEEEAVRFFARRNEYKKNQKNLLAKRDSLYKVLSTELKAGNDTRLNELKNEILNIDNKILVKRKEFLNSLGDLLTEKEIARFLLFEYNFRNEIRKQLMKRHKGKM